MNTGFSKNSYELLNKAGWKPGRHVELPGINRLALSNGYSPLSSKAASFLEEFNDLRVQFEHQGEIIKLYIDIQNSLEHHPGADTVEKWRKAIGRAFWPIGRCGFDRILIDAEGAIYGWSDPYLDVIAEDGNEGMERLILMDAPTTKRLLPYHDDIVKSAFQASKRIAVIGDFESASNQDPEYGVAEFFRKHNYDVVVVTRDMPTIDHFRTYTDVDNIIESVDILYVESQSFPLRKIVEYGISNLVKLIWIEFVEEYDVDAEEHALEAGIVWVEESPGIEQEYERILGEQAISSP